MNDIRENKFSRNLKVEGFFNHHEAELVPAASGLAAYVAEYRAINVALTGYAMIGNEDITGARKEKIELRNAMRDLAVSVAAALRAHFKNINDSLAADKVYLTNTAINKGRDKEVYVKCKWILESANANSAAIVPLGATADKLTALSNAIDAYFAKIQDPQDEKKIKKTAMTNFDIAMKESEQKLDTIKNVMKMLKIDFPSLYSQFKSACAIDNNVGRRKKSV